MSTFTDELFEMLMTTDKGLVTGEPHAPIRRSWSDVYKVAQRMAAALAAAGVRRGDSIGVLAGQPYDVAPLVLAVWLCGASFTMLHQPTPRANLESWIADTIAVLRMIKAKVVVVGDPFGLSGHVLARQGFHILNVGQLDSEPQVEPVAVTDDDIAILQLTSGSTGAPKAVAISHRNLYHNHRAMAEASAADRATDVTISWLPLFHDMGMIGFLIEPMICGLETVCVTPLEFLTSPLLWAELITKYRGTMTAAPNFAYAVLARRLRNAPDGAYDLSSLRFVLNGAEPIDVATIEPLLDAGGRFGLRQSALVAAFGMAEATLAVSFSALHQPLSVDTVDVDKLEFDGVAAPDATNRTREFLLLGAPLPGLEVRVVDESRSVVGTRRVGELEIRGEAVTCRYLTPNGFEPAVDAEQWLATGDLGYLTEEGEIVVSGRKKDLIIIAGRNLWPTDIEKAACLVDGVRPGNAAAVRITGNGRREDFAVIVENAHANDRVEYGRIKREVSKSVLNHVGAAPGLVVIVPPGDLPKTPSGKIRRSAATALLPESAEATSA